VQDAENKDGFIGVLDGVKRIYGAEVYDQFVSGSVGLWRSLDEVISYSAEIGVEVPDEYKIKE
jgi:hypothetical protein